MVGGDAPIEVGGGFRDAAVELGYGGVADRRSQARLEELAHQRVVAPRAPRRARWSAEQRQSLGRGGEAAYVDLVELRDDPARSAVTAWRIEVRIRNRWRSSGRSPTTSSAR